MSTTENFPSLVDKIPPDRITSASSNRSYFRRGISPEKFSVLEIYPTSYKSSSILNFINGFERNYSLSNQLRTFIFSKEHHPSGSIIPQHNIDHGEPSRLQEFSRLLNHSITRSLVITIL